MDYLDQKWQPIQIELDRQGIDPTLQRMTKRAFYTGAHSTIKIVEEHGWLSLFDCISEVNRFMLSWKDK